MDTGVTEEPRGALEEMRCIVRHGVQRASTWRHRGNRNCTWRHGVNRSALGGAREHLETRKTLSDTGHRGHRGGRKARVLEHRSHGGTQGCT